MMRKKGARGLALVTYIGEDVYDDRWKEVVNDTLLKNGIVRANHVHL